uniref:U-scoloptoxin(17)-Er1a n=1 Tax=Ethmostigmus rubripes TaxID=62613 RepID=TXH1A_ETHRU|nr:RecName: Full=U-scoloptoxin(17)-Er1a; Short=U-SLPTX(17)-Er1a; Flags: Precursor [Ethmostigmus rubripes]
MKLLVFALFLQVVQLSLAQDDGKCIDMPKLLKKMQPAIDECGYKDAPTDQAKHDAVTCGLQKLGIVTQNKELVVQTYKDYLDDTILQHKTELYNALDECCPSGTCPAQDTFKCYHEKIDSVCPGDKQKPQ